MIRFGVNLPNHPGGDACRDGVGGEDVYKRQSYHGVTYTERFGLGGAYITKATVQLMRDFGATPAPMNAYLLNVGLETLHLRMPQHCANALAVEWVTMSAPHWKRCV